MTIASRRTALRFGAALIVPTIVLVVVWVFALSPAWSRLQVAEEMQALLLREYNLLQARTPDPETAKQAHAALAQQVSGIGQTFAGANTAIAAAAVQDAVARLLTQRQAQLRSIGLMARPGQADTERVALRVSFSIEHKVLQDLLYALHTHQPPLIVESFAIHANASRPNQHVQQQRVAPRLSVESVIAGQKMSAAQ